MDILCELTTFMSVTEEPGEHGDSRANDLDWNVPSRTNDLE
jgi:hypothetical protein